jgi:hypothetical protein
MAVSNIPMLGISNHSESNATSHAAGNSNNGKGTLLSRNILPNDVKF